MTSVSVITPAHNPLPKYLDRVLASLRRQTVPLSQWEYVLVDNRSDKTLAGWVDLSWHPNARHVREETLGLTPARLRGIEESKGELLVFVDDDNVLDPDFLQSALRIAQDKPMIGAWSGQCRPEFDQPPPPWTRRYWSGLVIRQFEGDFWSNLPEVNQTMPNGAGLCVRRAVADHYVRVHRTGERPLWMDRTGSSLLSGGDNDLAACACDVGLGIGLFSALKLTHLIRPERLRERYLLNLAESSAYSGVIVQSFRSAGAPRPRSLRRRSADWIRWILAGSPQRRFFSANRRGYDRGVKAARAMRSHVAGTDSSSS